MAVSTTVTQLAAEEITYKVSFLNACRENTGATLGSIVRTVVSAIVVATTGLTTATPTVASTSASTKISGTTPGTYNVRVTATLSDGDKRAYEFAVTVVANAI